LARFFSVQLGFFGLARFSLGFSGLARFFSGFLSVSVRFGSVRFFWFFAYKTETEPIGFFKNVIGLIGFFFGSVFFFRFSRFNHFPVFLLTSIVKLVVNFDYLILLVYSACLLTWGKPLG
jgi:hypothetical protein